MRGHPPPAPPSCRHRSTSNPLWWRTRWLECSSVFATVFLWKAAISSFKEKGTSLFFFQQEERCPDNFVIPCANWGIAAESNMLIVGCACAASVPVVTCPAWTVAVLSRKVFEWTRRYTTHRMCVMSIHRPHARSFNYQTLTTFPWHNLIVFSKTHFLYHVIQLSVYTSNMELNLS